MASVDQTNSNVVEMVDQSTPFGATVDFGNKAKTRVITQITSNGTDESVESGKDVAMFWAFRNGKVVSLNFFVPAGGRPLAAEEQSHGIQQKIGDSYAQAEKDAPDDVQMIVEMTLDNLLAGRWAKQAEGSTPGIPGLTGDLIEAVRRTFVAVGGSRVEEFRDPEEGKVAAKNYLIGKYNAVVDRVAELRIPTGDAERDANNTKTANANMKAPLDFIIKDSGVSFQLARIKREKAEIAEANKQKAVPAAGGVLADFE